MKAQKFLTLAVTAAALAVAVPGTAIAATGQPASAQPAAAHWYYYSNYPTYHACNTAGFELEINQHAIANYKCVEVELDGYTTVWYLYYLLGEPPGS